MDDYLTKPIRADDLHRVLANVRSTAVPHLSAISRDRTQRLPSYIRSH